MFQGLEQKTVENRIFKFLALDRFFKTLSHSADVRYAESSFCKITQEEKQRLDIP